MDLAFTDVLNLQDGFVCNISPQLSWTDTLVFNESWVKYATLQLSWTDKLQLSEGTFRYKYDKNHIMIPSFFSYVNLPDRFIILWSTNGALVLAPPVFGDSESNLNEVSVLTTVGGKRYSYVKTIDRKHLKYEFQFRQTKVQQLQQFIDDNNLEPFALTNWKGEFWNVLLMTNPIEYVAISRDWYSVVLEFQGYKSGGDYPCIDP